MLLLGGDLVVLTLVPHPATEATRGDNRLGGPQGPQGGGMLMFSPLKRTFSQYTALHPTKPALPDERTQSCVGCVMYVSVVAVWWLRDGLCAFGALCCCGFWFVFCFFVWVSCSSPKAKNLAH